MLRKIRSLVSNSNPSYIGIYDNILPSAECERLISLFEKSPKIEGKCYSEGSLKVNPEYKKCIELDDCKFSKGDVITNIFSPYLREGIDKYKNEYPVLDTINMGKLYDKVVIDDLRYQNEHDVCIKNGYKIIVLTLPKDIQIERLKVCYPDNFKDHIDNSKHESESGIECSNCTIIDMSLDLDTIRNIVYKYLYEN